MVNQLQKAWLWFWNGAQWGATALVFVTATWWWRAFWLRDLGAPQWIDRLYFIHFGFAVFVIAALLAWLLTGLRGVVRLTESGNVVVAVLVIQLALWGRISYGADVRNPEIALSYATQLIVVALFTVSLLANPIPMRWAVAALVAGMLLQVSLGLAQTSLQGKLGVQVIQDAIGVNLRLEELRLDPQKSGVSVVEADGVRYLRPYGLSGHPNLMAGGVVLGLCASLGAWLSPAARRWAVIAGVVGAWGVLLTFSRAVLGGFVLGAMVCVGLWWLLPRPLASRQEIWGAVGAMLLTALLVGAFFVGIYAPLLGVRFGVAHDEVAPTFEDYSAASRAVYREQALALIKQQPWRGVGIGNFAWESAYLLQFDWRDLRGDNVHNIYLLALAEVGGVGFAFYLGAIVVSLGLILRRARRGEITPTHLGLASGVVAWLGIGWFDHYAWTQFGFQLLFWGALGVALSSSTAGRKTQNPN